jgi:S1-C subfamily serine protease
MSATSRLRHTYCANGKQFSSSTFYSGGIEVENQTSEKTNQLITLSRDLAAAVERVSPSVVAVNARPRVATSGVLWRPGVVVATHHTIEREEEITVLLHDGREAPATLIGRDASTDLAVLKIDEASGAADIVDQADELKVGHLILAVGRTSGEGVSASLGCISAVGGAWRAWQGGIIDHFVRLDLNIYIGFSGSPLVSADGRVLGINTSGLGRGSALTIPAVTVNRVVDALLKGGSIPRPYIGVGMQPVRLPDAIKSKLNLVNGAGVIVLSVEPGSPADKAGFLVGDVLVALGAAAVTDIDDVQATLAPGSVGQTIDASVVRGGERTNLAVTIGERSAQRRRGE